MEEKLPVASRGLEPLSCECHKRVGLLRLRQAACFPAHMRTPLASAPPAKFAVFEDLMMEILSEGDKVLMFSQYVKSLSVLKQSLEKAGEAWFSRWIGGEP